MIGFFVIAAMLFVSFLFISQKEEKETAYHLIEPLQEAVPRLTKTAIEILKDPPKLMAQSSKEPSFDAEQFSALLTQSMKKAEENNLAREQKLLDAAMRLAIDHMATKHKRSPSNDIFIGRMEVGLWGDDLSNRRRLFNVFIERFGKYCADNGIKTHLSSNGEYLIVDCKTLSQYNETPLQKEKV